MNFISVLTMNAGKILQNENFKVFDWNLVFEIKFELVILNE